MSQLNEPQATYYYPESPHHRIVVTALTHMNPCGDRSLFVL